MCAHGVESGVDKGAVVQVGGESQAEQHREYTADTVTMGTVCPQYAISAHRTCTRQHRKGLTTVLPIPMPIPSHPPHLQVAWGEEEGFEEGWDSIN